MVISSRAKLLFLTEVFPYPLDRGQHVRVYNLLAACADACDTTFLGPEPAAEVDRAPVERLCNRVVYAQTVGAGGLERAATLAHTLWHAPGLRTPSTVQRLAPFMAALRTLRSESFDLIWAERPQMACLSRELEAKVILDFDDIEHVKAARRLSVDSALQTRLYGLYQYTLYRHIELSWCRKTLASVVCSEPDRAYLAARGCENAVIVPNAPNVQDSVAPSRRPADPSAPLRLVFLGHVLAAPNADAIEFLAREVLPALRAQVPDVELDVIGPGATPDHLRRYASHVRFVGFVDDLKEALGRYDMLVAPLRFGSGTKLKVLDAMENALPVVTTAVGAEGLGIEHGRHALIAETVPDMVRSILTIKRDAALAASLTANARRLVRDRFSWKTIRGDVASWVGGLAEKRRSLDGDAAVQAIPLGHTHPSERPTPRGDVC